MSLTRGASLTCSVSHTADCATCGQAVMVESVTAWHGPSSGVGFVLGTGRASAGTPGRACEHEGSTVATVARFERAHAL